MNNPVKMKKTNIIVWILILVGITGQVRAAELDRYLENLYRSHIIPGFSVVVVQEDQVLFSKGYGLEYTDGNRPMTSNTSTALGSLAKSFTALAMMQLVEKGIVDLDDPVVRYLPWFRTANKTLSDHITIRMLLNNTSGLKAPVVRNSDISDRATEKLVRSMESVYLTDEPGTSYSYSNDGFAVAGLIISELTGMSYEEYLDQNIFEPLEMNRTTNDPDDYDDLNVLFGHQPGIDRAIPVHSEDETLREYVAAGSLLRSSANDVGHYLIAMVNGGRYKNKQIVSRGSIDEMWKSYSEFPGISEKDGGDNSPFHYGLGWFKGKLDQKQYVFHGGNRRSMSSMTFIYPEKKLGVSFLANVDLTLIDRYRYPNLITIVNNIVRLTLGEQVSDFAVPVVPDPTLNNYLPAENEEDNYTGEYLLTGGSDWVYLGTRLTVSKGPHGLVGTILKGDQLIEEFNIDFINQKSAVTRNISMPHRMQFSLINNGRTSELFMAGKKYSRVSEGYYSHFRPEASINQRVGFYFPENWILSWEGEDFRGADKQMAGETIEGHIFPGDNELAEYFKKMFPEHQIIYTGQQLSEISGSFFWEEMAIVSSRDHDRYQHFLCVTKRENKNYVIALTSQKNLTSGVSNLMTVLMGSFSWKP